MKMIYIFIIFILTACSPLELKNDLTNYNFSFSSNMKFEQFRFKVKEYADKSNFPNIDN